MTDDPEAVEEVLRSRIRVSPRALVRHLPDGSSVILDLESEKYFGLDAVAVDMWDALSNARQVEAARDRLLEMYDVEQEKLTADLVDFISTLRSRGLLDVDADDQPLSGE